MLPITCIYNGTQAFGNLMDAMRYWEALQKGFELGSREDLNRALLTSSDSQ